MAQHTQPVAQQEPTQQAHQTQNSTASSTTPQPTNNTNNNANQSQMQQSQQSLPQNNNIIVPAQSFTPAGGPPPSAVSTQPLFNPPMHAGNVLMSAPGVHQHASMYPAMIPAPLPSNVYVNNVTANVNLHSWPQAYISGAPPHYIQGDIPQDQHGQVLHPMPVALGPANAINAQGNGQVPSYGGRGTRRGKGRGGGGSRRDYQRYPPPESSPVSQQIQQNQEQMQQSMGQSQQLTQMDNQIIAGGPPAYAPHPQYMQYPYPAYFTPQTAMIHPSQTAAQQPGGPPYIMSPMYHQPMYNYVGGYIFPSVMNSEYYLPATEDGQGDDRQNVEGMMPQMWHQQQIYSEEYMSAEMQGEDLNQNNSSSETPGMLSPNYPIYDPQMHEMQQRMEMMEIYNDPNMAQMQEMHPGAIQQLDDNTHSGSIQMVSAGAIITAPMSMQNDQQMVHHGHIQPPPPHMMHAGILGIDPQLHQSAGAIEHVAPENYHSDSNQNEHENFESSDSITNLSEVNQQSIENITQDYQLQQQLTQGAAVEMTSTSVSTENFAANEMIENVPNAELVSPPLVYTTLLPTQQFQTQHQQQQQQPQQHHQQQQQPQQQHQQQQQPQQQLQHQQLQNQHQHQQNAQQLSQEQLQQNQQQLEQPQQQIQSQKQQLQQQFPSEQQIQADPAQLNLQNAYQSQEHLVPEQSQEHEAEFQPQINQQHQLHQYQSPPLLQEHQEHKEPKKMYHIQQKHYHPQQQHMYQQQKQLHAKQQYQSQVQQSSIQNQNQQQLVAQSNQQQQMHGQQSHDQRKQAPSNNNPHSRRKYAVEYGNNNTNVNNNTNSLNQNQHQSSNTNSNNDSIVQATKSMSWTNSSQHKKSTASVAVTATPTSNVNSNAGKQYSHSHSRTYTNQHHHHHSQQSQNNYSQPQARSYSGPKVPSSPVTVAPTSVERKHSQVDQIPKVSTSTATTNIINNINNTAVATQISTSVVTNSTPQNIPPSQNASINEVNTLSNKQYPGFANKKQTIATTTSLDGPPVTVTAAPTINLAPPIPAVTSSNNTGSTWASLFITKNSITSNTAVSASAQTTSSTSLDKSNDSPALPPPFSSKKPIAKVAPYDGNNTVVAQTTLPVVTPGTMSYSAASAQGLLNTATIGQSSNASRNTKTQSTLTTQAAPRRNSAHLDEWSQKYADHLVKYKTELSNVSLRPRGLTNRSNYCYINSILQALMGCSPFYNLIRSIPKQAATLCDVKTPTINAMISLMSNFSTLPGGQRLRTNNKNSKGKDDLGAELQCDPSFEPTEIYKLWNESREEHSEGRQEDAEEFLGYVLNKLNDEMLEIVKLVVKPTTVNGQNDQNENDDGDAWQMICNNRNKGSITRQTDFGRTPLSDIFRGELRSRLQREGEHSTDDIQPFFTLQLNIEKAASVKEALEILVGRDQLEGVTGSKTKQEVVAWQQMTLEKLPTILILHLKWFDYKSDGCTKILKKVDFPVELKIDTKILASKKYSQKQRAYRLFAVVYHDGKEASKGHYITDVFHTGYNSWLRFDDSTVKPVNENHVLYPHIPRVPYLLYYRRCDTLPHTTATANNANTNSSLGSRASDGK